MDRNIDIETKIQETRHDSIHKQSNDGIKELMLIDNLNFHKHIELWRERESKIDRNFE